MLPISPLTGLYHFVNQPQHKEAIKNVCGVATFAFALYELYDISYLGMEYLKGKTSDTQGTCWKLLNITARLSILLSGATSRPGIALTRWSFSFILTPQQMETIAGGVATNFATNHTQLRHIANLSACLSGVPSTLKVAIDASLWLKGKILTTGNSFSFQNGNWKHMKVAFSTLTSRTSLHVINSGLRQIVRI